MLKTLKKRILVVDDEPDFVWMLRLRLEASDFDVFTAKDGREALKKVKADHPEVILLDIFIPGAGGLSVLRMIRRSDKNVPVYMLTSSGDKKSFLAAKRLGASGFIMKTNNLQKEIDHIKSALHMSGNYRGAAK
jgi:DNA-binding NtrC family response regulator